MSLHEIIDKARTELDAKSRLHELAQNSGREIVRASKQTVLYVHQGDLKKAGQRLQLAKRRIRQVVKLSGRNPELVYTGSFILACQEYAEAQLLLSYVKDGKLLSWTDIGVQPLPYLLGLGDLIGELRRSVVDLLRNGRVEKAEGRLRFMEEVYMEVFAIDNPLALSGGLRRKLDVARKLIEITRSEVSVEVRRRALEESIEGLQKALAERKPC